MFEKNRRRKTSTNAIFVAVVMPKPYVLSAFADRYKTNGEEKTSDTKTLDCLHNSKLSLPPAQPWLVCRICEWKGTPL